MNYELLKSFVYLEYLELGLALPKSSPEDVTLSQKRKFRKIFKKYYKNRIKRLIAPHARRFQSDHGFPGDIPTPRQKKNREKLVYQEIYFTVREKYINRSVS